jgi:hypothetical protein
MYAEAGVRDTRNADEGALHRWRVGDRVAQQQGQDDLVGESQQVPETVSPGFDCRAWRVVSRRDGQREGEERKDQRDGEGIGHPPDEHANHGANQ